MLRPIRVGWRPPAVKRVIVFVLMALPIFWISMERTFLGAPPTRSFLESELAYEDYTLLEHLVRERRIPLARANLIDAQLSVKPADWLDRQIARLDFRRGLPAGINLEGQENQRHGEWWQRRKEYISQIKAPNLRRADLRGALLRDAFLVGADLSYANLVGANLRDAHLEGADLTGAHLQGADLRPAHLGGLR